MQSRTLAALTVYAEPIVVGRRVLLVGHGGLADRLTELGARSVRVFEPTAGEDFDVRDGAFDVAIVPELDDVRDRDVLLSRLRRVLGPDGAVIVATARVSDEAYYALYDAVSLQFGSVVMLALVPFEGMTIAQLGSDDDVEVSVDTQLAPASGAPAAFVALASHADLGLSPYSIIGVPADRERDAPAPAELAEARLLADVQGSQLEEERAQRQQLEREVHKLEDALAAERSARSAAERAALSADDLMLARQRIAVLEADLESQGEALQKKSEETLILLAELDALRSAPPPSDSRAEDAAQRIAFLEEELSALEERLQERAATIAGLERDLRHRERVAQELVVLVQEAQTDPAAGTVPDTSVAELEAKLDEAALTAARRESELLARSWRIAELESRLVKAAPPRAEGKTTLEDEVLALRQALAQEHEARVRAESGEELEKARAELERQEVLLAQLGAELEVRR